MLRDSLLHRSDVTLRSFGWRAAIFGRYDVLHVHWPEIWVTGRTWSRRAARQLLTLVLLGRTVLTRTPVVRTLHNVEVREGVDQRGRWLLDLLERRTRVAIRLNPTTDPSGKAALTVLHGHYRDWFKPYDKPSARPGRISFIGLIRPYKGVTQLLQAFLGLPGDYTLHIAGKPNPELVDELVTLAGQDERVQLSLGYVSDRDLVAAVCSAELVVFPYRHLHNSGSALAALSLDRPVLVPRNAVTEALADEVGPGWVLFYSGELSGERLGDAISEVRSGHRDLRPDLSAREWGHVGELHVQAYRRALDRRRQEP